MHCQLVLYLHHDLTQIMFDAHGPSMQKHMHICDLPGIGWVHVCMCLQPCVFVSASGVHVCHQVCVMHLQVRGILDANGKVGLGVDGSSSNETVNLMDDCRIATYLQRSGGNPKGVLFSLLNVQKQLHVQSLLLVL